MINFHNMDCIDFLKTIKTESIDLCIIDPPYIGIDDNKLSDGKKIYFNFDEKQIDKEKTINEIFRTVRTNGKIIIFGNIKTLLKWTRKRESLITDEAFWIKKTAANFLSANSSLLHVVEPIVILTKKNGIKDFEKCKKVFIKVKEKINEQDYKKKYNDYMYSHYFPNLDGTQFVLIPEYKYKELNIKSIINKEYNEILKIYEYEKNKIPKSTYNKIYKENGQIQNNIFEFKKDSENIQPTQKPLELIKTLIKIYSNEGDSVLDCFAGSGTTLIAAEQLKRNSFGCEKDLDRFNNAKNRINKIIKEV